MGKAAVFGAVLVTLAWTPVDLDACGDKYVRVGGSARLRQYAAIHPASILIYAKPGAEGASEFADMLKRAGHHPAFIAPGTNIAQAAASTRYDLIIANYANAAGIQDQLRSLPARPDLVPMIDKKPTKAVEAQARKDYHSILAPYRMSKVDALEEIDHAMATRLKGVTPAGAFRK